MPINSEGELLLGVHASASIWKVGSTFVAIQGDRPGIMEEELRCSGAQQNASIKKCKPLKHRGKE
jgi:hypothetical protein